MKTTIKIMCAATVIAVMSLWVSAQVPAFPGAEGGGAVSVGGRGGAIIKVTNLNDSGTGSFREALRASGPRIVVFSTSGVIYLNSQIDVRNPYMTIAGQTAPGEGVIISGATMDSTPIVLREHDIIIRFLKVRTGMGATSQSGDCIACVDGSYNVIIDHCSMSWSNDENTSNWPAENPSHDITFSWNMITEGLSYDHVSCGLIVGSNINSVDILRVDIHHNMFMNNDHRNPLFKGGSTKIVNNIIYNWARRATMFDGGPILDFIGNLYRRGPSSDPQNKEIVWRPNIDGGPNYGPYCDPSIYIAGNSGPNQADPNADNWNMMDESTDYDYAGVLINRLCERLTPQSRDYPITVYDVGDLESIMLSDLGASRRLDENGDWIVNRDPVDERVIGDFENGLGAILVTEADVGGYPVLDPGVPYTDTDNDGMPDAWETARGLNPSVDDSAGDDDSDEYTNIEEFLNAPFSGATIPERIQLDTGTYNIGEEKGSVTITVRRTGEGVGAVSVAYATSDGTAMAGTDYTAASGILTWADGDMASRTFAITITNDNDIENDETITITLDSPEGGAVLGFPNAAVLTIIDDDDVTDVSDNNSIRIVTPYLKSISEGGSVSFQLSGTEGSSRLRILTMGGRLVRVFNLEEGESEVDWNLLNSSGSDIRPGLYLYALVDDGGNIRTGKIAITK